MPLNESLEQKVSSSNWLSKLDYCMNNYWKPLPWGAINLFIAGVSIDASSTYFFMITPEAGGINAESNPIMRYAAENLGIGPGVAVASVGLSIAAGIAYYHLWKYIGKKLITLEKNCLRRV